MIGGGITGLAAAFRLVELAPECRISVFEKANRLGGVLWTVHEDGYQVEQSADNFITTVPWGVDLCKRLGLGGELMQTNPAFRQTSVLRRGRLYKLPDGFLMMAPTRMWPLAVTPILSPLGKLRAAMEYFLPARRSDEDESVASFVRRRLGNEVFERLVEPLVSAVYAADMEKLSVEATLSRDKRFALERIVTASRSAGTLEQLADAWQKSADISTDRPLTRCSMRPPPSPSTLPAIFTWRIAAIMPCAGLLWTER